MTSQSVVYRPYKEKQWQNIKELWVLYKESIGLEGDISLRLVHEGKSQSQINEVIGTHRDDVKNNLEAWHGLRGEKQ